MATTNTAKEQNCKYPHRERNINISQKNLETDIFIFHH